MVATLHKFELIDSQQFKLPADNGIVATHLATLRWGLREFVFFVIDYTGKSYIEEVLLAPSYTNGKLTAKYGYVEDNELWQGLGNFLKEKGITGLPFPCSNIH